MKIVMLPGDGIGPEVLAATLEVLGEVAGDLTYEERLIGGAAIDATGTALPDETLESCKRADAVLLAAVAMASFEEQRRRKREQRKTSGAFEGDSDTVVAVSP